MEVQRKRIFKVDKESGIMFWVRYAKQGFGKLRINNHLFYNTTSLTISSAWMSRTRIRFTHGDIDQGNA